jgi:hypothetical protein
MSLAGYFYLKLLLGSGLGNEVPLRAVPGGVVALVMATTSKLLSRTTEDTADGARGILQNVGVLICPGCLRLAFSGSGLVLATSARPFQEQPGLSKANYALPDNKDKSGCLFFISTNTTCYCQSCLRIE